MLYEVITQQQAPAAQFMGEANRRDHLPSGVSLVEMVPPLENQDPFSGKTAGNKPAGVTSDPTRRKGVKFVIGKYTESYNFV